MYPEHEKLARAQGEIDLLKKFIDWLRQPGNRFRIGTFRSADGDQAAGFFPDDTSVERLVYLYLGINPTALEQERREMNEYRVTAARINGEVHRIKQTKDGVRTGCGERVFAGDVMVCTQLPKDIDCPDPGCQANRG